ncbi:hypothetical protein OG568_52175 (plasmid) [Streptomyces sp. NBC_01450]|uniref:hypothetical protein n=1 Tax=Streptomyces sp. NBC_01450 TaxID=2903871 RepID=UPI002E336375|nr:hypothetical protein [Streptomyces sp. NBC_01450]
MFGFHAVTGFLTTSPLGGKTLGLAPNPLAQGLWLGGAEQLLLRRVECSWPAFAALMQQSGAWAWT